MQELTDLQLYAGIGGAPVVIFLIEVLKNLLGLKADWEKRLIPLFSILLGIVWNVLVVLVRADAVVFSVPVVIVLGIFTGMAAMGGYSGAKATFGVKT